MAFKQVVAAVFLLSALGAPVARAGNAATPRERLDRATAATSLDDITAHPWHLKLSVRLFDAQGKNPIDATIEYWKEGAETLRVITIGASTQTELNHDGQRFFGSSGDKIPQMALAVFDAFMHIGPNSDELDGSQPELRKVKFGKASLDCIMLSQPLKNASQLPIGLFPTYCLDPAADRIVATYDFGSREINVTSAGRFLDHQVAIGLSLVEEGVAVATANVVSLATFSPDPDRFTPTPQLVAASTSVARIGSGVVAGSKIGGNPPRYPESARAGHIQGTVILHALIGRDGHIRRLRVVSTPDPNLAISALAAVRTWVYRPYLLAGVPTEVDTTVIINYNLAAS